jgi:L,D-transpeptidase YcbB
MRKALFSLAISIACVTSAEAQTAPSQSPNRPAAKLAGARIAAVPAKPAVKPEGIAPVSKSPLPTFYGNTYQRIAAAMLSYTTIDLRGGWPTLPKTAQLAPGASGPDVVTLRQRLIVTDDLAPDQDKGELFDEKVEEAVKRFQSRHGLTETGSIGPKTLAALNVPVKERLRQLRATLDRISELNFSFGQRYVVVNIPAAVAEAVDGDTVQKRYVVVVGKVGRASPTLTTTINAST